MKYEGEPKINYQEGNKAETEYSDQSAEFMPVDKKYEEPIVMSPGWGNQPEKNDDFYQKLANKSSRVVYPLEYSRDKKIELESSEHPTVELEKAIVINSTIEEKGLGPVNGVGYSEGAQNLMIAALEHPENFKTITLVNPAGLIGQDNFFGLVYRFSRGSNDFMKKAYIDQKEKPAFKLTNFLKYIATKPVKSFQEVSAISKADILFMMKELKEKGIGISVIAGVDDMVFPMDKMQKSFSGKKSKDYLDGFYSVKGAHHNILVDPSKNIDLMATAVNDLNKKISKKA